MLRTKIGQDYGKGKYYIIRKDIEMNKKEFIKVTDIGFEGREGNKDKHSKEVFDYILKGTPFESYASDIFDKLLSIKYGNVSLLKEERMERNREYFQRQKDIAEALLICKSYKKLELCAGCKKTELSEKIKKIVEEELEKDYKEAYLNYEPMDFEEGKWFLTINHDEDTQKFIDDYWKQYADELGLDAEERAGGYDYDDIPDDMVEMYIEGREMSVEITKEQIEKKLASINEAIKHNTKIRKGAPKKNLKLHCAINVFQDTKQYVPSNKTYRTIYRYLDFLEMIDESQKKVWETTTTPNPEVSYMKQLCKEALKYRARIFSFRVE